MRTTLGNMGEAQTKCQFWYTFSNQKTDIKCHTGQISKLVHYGLKPKHEDIS